MDTADETTDDGAGTAPAGSPAAEVQPGRPAAGAPLPPKPARPDPYADRSPYPPPAANRGFAGWSTGFSGGPPLGGGTAGAAPPTPGPGGAWPQPHAGFGQPMRMPSGLFPSGPPRPVYREPHPIQGGAVALGIVGGGLWMMLFGLLASTAGGYAWISIVAGLVASGVAVLLARLGDRGAAAGVAMAVAVGLSVAAIVVAARWAGGDWILW